MTPLPVLFSLYIAKNKDVMNMMKYASRHRLRFLKIALVSSLE